jgi:colicin import membrane protein
MHAHSPGSYSLSLMLHGVIVVAILLSAYIFNDARKNTGAQIIELVAGPGDNYMGTVAPALGAPDATDVPDIAFPPPPAVPPSPAPPVVEPIVTPASNPIVPVPPDALIVPPAKKAPPPKNLPKTTPKTTPETQVKNMTWEEFQKQNAIKNKNMPSSRPVPNKQTNAPAKPITPPKIGQGLSKGVLGGVGTAAGAGGTALAAAERDQMDGYFALLAQRIREAQQKPEGLGSELTVRIEFQVYASGAIGAVKVIRSSGNRAFDDSVLKAIRAVRPIGARPDGKSGSKTADFRMREEE